MLTLVHEHGLSYTTLSEALSSLSVGTDRYRNIFSTTIAVKYQCQGCYWRQFDKLGNVVVLDQPLHEYCAPQPRPCLHRQSIMGQDMNQCMTRYEAVHGTRHDSLHDTNRCIGQDMTHCMGQGMTVATGKVPGAGPAGRGDVQWTSGRLDGAETD